MSFLREMMMKKALLLVVLFYPLLSWKAPGSVLREEKRAVVNNTAGNPGVSGLVYDSLNLEQYGLSRRVFDLALKGWQRLRAYGRVTRENVVSIVDFSQPSFKKRLYVIDLVNPRLLFNTYVAHGRRSGKEVATRFSNRPRSLESSVGF
ncbi:MAG TPA: murein L,D-transpeptidase catalytic domain family protein, partial [Puia sp.]|nr:murein L,D-transpeptidase catalytic domain family protein [Puia sp.]